MMPTPWTPILGDAGLFRIKTLPAHNLGQSPLLRRALRPNFHIILSRCGIKSQRLDFLSEKVSLFPIIIKNFCLVFQIALEGMSTD